MSCLTCQRCTKCDLQTKPQRAIILPQYKKKKKEIDRYLQEQRWRLRAATLCDFGMSDKRLLTGTTRQQKAKLQIEAPKTRTPPLSPRGSASGRAVHNLFLIGASYNTVLHPTIATGTWETNARHCLHQNCHFLVQKPQKEYCVLIKMAGGKRELRENSCLALCSHFIFLFSRKGMKTE